MTAEPRMEELLASIRKAIHDDIGEVPSSMSGRSTGTLQRSSMRELHVKTVEEAASAAAEIQQLRDKINRSRAAEQAAPRETPQRPSDLAAALQQNQPRRSWRDLDPQPKLRPAILETERPVQHRAEYMPRRELPPEPPLRREPVAEPQVHYHQPAWPEEQPALMPPGEPVRPRPEQPSLLSGDASQAVQTAFNRLADTVLARATGDRTLEELTRDMLRAMLKQWLDDNLPALVEKLVREEIERVARNGR